MQGRDLLRTISRASRPGALLAIVLALLGAVLAGGATTARAATSAAPLTVHAERTTGGSEERLRIRVTGRTPSEGGPVRIGVSTVEPGSGCSAGRRDIDWHRLSAIGPRTRLPAGRAFTLVGTAAVAGHDGVRVCATMRRVGGGVLARTSTVVGSRVGAFLDPVVGRSLAAALEPVIRVVLPLLLVLAIAAGGWRVAQGVRRRRAGAARRRAAIARAPSRPHRLAAAHAGPSGDRFTALPPLPPGIVVPDAPPSLLLPAGEQPAVADALADDLATADPATAVDGDEAVSGTATLLPPTVDEPAAPPTASTTPAPGAGPVDRVARRLRSPRVRERRWQLERALQPLADIVDEIVLPEPATGDSALVIARRQRLAFLVLLADADRDADRRRLARLAAAMRDQRLGGLAPVPVLALRDAPAQARATAPHEDYPELEIWTASVDRLERFVAARIPARRATQRHRTR
ncbi:hypothetical protein SK069_05065 [Patulibacter brassicae]|uniref:DUF4129 domain-containing protein n=1 Tax=Patulibacter brassicae TaxID=1705717 RepID=A0ABU4VGL5_9ACTN|nr:hypothetical protein [Patulibacter brassicae]